MNYVDTKNTSITLKLDYIHLIYFKAVNLTPIDLKDFLLLPLSTKCWRFGKQENSLYFDESKMHIMCIRPLVSNTTATLKTRNMFWCFKKGGTGKREKCKTVKHLVFPKLLEDVKDFHLMLIYINLLSTLFLNRFNCVLF